MTKALLFVHSEKVPVRSRRYPHINLSRSTTIFPTEAREYLERLGKGKVMKVELGEEDLHEANGRWLKNRMLFVAINGELYTTRFMDEVGLLEGWARNGVSDEGASRYNRRLNAVRKQARALRKRLFQTGSARKLVRRIASLSEPRYSESGFADSGANLKRVTSPEQERFKESVLDVLIRPMDIGELSRHLRMNKSNLRKRLRLLLRSGLVKSTTKRIAVGRPKVVYFISRDI